MPVSEHGPVPLFPTEPGRGQPESAGADAASGAHEDAKAGPEAPQGEGEGSAAVAALAQRLARSAIGVLEASELENAQEVDFEHLDAESKAQVTERFADAIEVVAHAVQDEVSHPEIVEAQVPQPAPQQQPAVEIEVEVALAPATEVQPEVIAEVAVKTEAPAEAEAKVEARAEPEAEKAAAEPVAAPTPTPAEPVRLESAGQMAPGQPSVATATVAMQPPAQAQFMGAAQQLVPSQGGGALENVVREMLRPLLVQWLNENMPRVLENAIREEIAMRGLLPKSDS
jgi:cell pole-organizing protein PopZ